ncbi:cohesin subunit SA-1 isoform X2 [Synchiropus splendidus]|uniref:cohesin subunit SA-1 isoform X2 n=1 Tax=Synchiropus splendidus TaxID=270530 RepID=UPI00237E8ECB|nr:cohesin subunit SA-1 isoform X2 [Synchiropus splendidus]
MRANPSSARVASKQLRKGYSYFLKQHLVGYEMEDSDIQSMDEWDDSGSDYEATINTPKRKSTSATNARQPPKRPRRNTAARMTPSPNSRPRPQQSPQKRISAKDIFDAVCSGKSAMVTVVDEWLDIYKQSREDGLLVLINFIVQSCGCKGVVSREMLDSLQKTDIISQLAKDFKEDSANYPLCATGPQLRKFKAGFCEFAQVLVHSCRNSLVYDEYLFPYVLELLTGLSDSQLRAFRHTSTLLAIKLTTGLVEQSVIVSDQLQTTQRQYDMENNKQLRDRARDKLEELQAVISEMKENREELSSIIVSTFSGVFINRYRDRLPEIRAACIEELGVWLKTDPEYFLNDSCLKYLGWTLYDKRNVVRLQCVKVLQGLYQNIEFIGRLELFTSRFKERMLSMVMDKEPQIAVEVIKLLELINQSAEGGLEEEECGQIYPLVYVKHQGLASAAGFFLYNKLRSLIATEDGDNENTNSAFIHVLISFFIQSELHEHAAYLVDSLWAVAESELKDWDAMTTCLLQDSGLMYEDEGALIELMMCCMRQASEASPPVGRAQRKKSVKDKRIQEKDQRRITNHFIPLLPQLLTKYSADSGIVGLLLKAPLYFDLEMYSSSPSMEKHLDLLLVQICGIMLKHTETTVLDACATLVDKLCSDSFIFSSRADRAFSQLMDTLSECFFSNLRDLHHAAADEDNVYRASTPLKRLAALSSAKDPRSWRLFQPCMQLMKSQIESGFPDREFLQLMVSALRCAAHHLIWAKVSSAQNVMTEAELGLLEKQVPSFYRVCEMCLSVNEADIRNVAFELLCDLLLIYSKPAHSHPNTQSLVCLPSESLRAEMGAFLVDYIFTDDEDLELSGEEEEEQKITELQRKRSLLRFSDFGDIIKETLSRTRQISPVLSAKTICLSLQQLFSEMMSEEQQDLSMVQELAKRLASSFGVFLPHERKPLMALHSDGIRFALKDANEEQQPNVAFLEILSQFSSKLVLQDRMDIASSIRSQCPTTALSGPSVKMYQRSLEGHLFKVSEVQDKGEVPVINTATSSSMDESSFHSGFSTPIMTSTLLRQPATPVTTTLPKILESEDERTSTEPESEEDFSSGFMRRVKPIRRRVSAFTSSASLLDQPDSHSHSTMLSPIEDLEEPEEEEAHMSHYETDDEGSCTLPSTRHISIMDELFD